MNVTELEKCIDAYGTDIYSFCKQLTCSVQEAEDLYQDTFLKAMELSWKIEYEKNPKSYLLSIAIRIWKNRKRKYAWRSRIAGEEELSEAVINIVPDTGVSVEELVITDETRRQVEMAVKGLEEKYRIPVYLFYLSDFSVKDISKLLKLPEGTVKSRLHKARNILKKRLEVIIYE